MVIGTEVRFCYLDPNGSGELCDSITAPVVRILLGEFGEVVEIGDFGGFLISPEFDSDSYLYRDPCVPDYPADQLDSLAESAWLTLGGTLPSYLFEEWDVL